MAAAVADWVVYVEASDFLTLVDETCLQCAERLWQSMAALPNTTPFAVVATTIACTADVPLDIRAALLEAADCSTFWTALVVTVVTAARPEDQGGMLALPASAEAATQHIPGASAAHPTVQRPAWALKALARVRGAAPPPAAAPPAAPQPTSPPPPNTCPAAPHTSPRTRCPSQRPWPRPHGSRHPAPQPCRRPPGQPPPPLPRYDRPLAGGIPNPSPRPRGAAGVPRILPAR